MPGTIQCTETHLNEIELLDVSSLVMFRHSTRVILFITHLFTVLITEEPSESMYNMFLFVMLSSLILEEATDIAITSV